LLSLPSTSRFTGTFGSRRGRRYGRRTLRSVSAVIRDRQVAMNITSAFVDRYADDLTVNRYKSELARMSSLRSIRPCPTPRNARGLKLASSEEPTIWPASLIPIAMLLGQSQPSRGPACLFPGSTGRRENWRRNC
jgi:hypothetical protein